MLSGGFINEQLKKIYYERGDWTAFTFYDCFLENAAKYPGQIAVVDKHKRISYSTLREQVNRVAGGLRRFNIGREDIVSVQLPNWAEWIILCLACAKIGAVFNPIPVNARHKEVKYILNFCQPRLFVIPDQFRGFNYMDMVRSLQKEVNVPAVAVVANGAETASVPGPFLAFADLAQYSPSAGESAQEAAGENGHNVSADDPFVLLFTSGTEAEPKGVIHTHNTILFSERSLAQALSIGNDDAVLAVSPLSHATGFLRGVVLPLIAGAKTVLADHFSPPAAMNIICAEICTFSMGATPFLHDLLTEILAAKEPYDLSHFRFFLCGGAPVPRHLAAQASQIGFKVLAVYGSTESPPHTVSGLQEGDESLPDHDGKPLPGIEVKIVDEHRNILPPGEIGEEASRGPNVFVGYFKQPELTQKYLDKDGWYYSGDLCVLERDNHLRVVGRKKDMIIRGGQNISPGEIEQMLYKHPKIDKVAVVGIPDERMGEKVAAFVVPAKGETFTFAEMIEFLEKEQIAKYKYPEKLLIVRDLPQTPAGKIQKYKLKNVLIMNTGEPRSFIFEHRLNSGD